MGFDKNLDLVGEESVKLNEMVWEFEIICGRKSFLSVKPLHMIFGKLLVKELLSKLLTD